jgi:hypothetical protein
VASGCGIGHDSALGESINDLQRHFFASVSIWRFSAFFK